MNFDIRQGNALDRLREMPDSSVNCCITSPPYFGLRDYGTAEWEGGDAACDHGSTRRGHGNEKQASSAGTSRDSLAGSTECRKCGARRIDQQIGLESTPDQYIARLVEVFREVRRVLREDGTCWVNIGDSYNAQPGQRKTTDKAGDKQATSIGSVGAPSRCVDGIKPKDLIGIPWSLAFALRADGWYLRQDIIWHKPNPMPESVKDRCTKAHEYIFLLSKSQRYWWDADAIAEAATFPGNQGYLRGTFDDASDSIAWRAKSQIDRRKAGADSYNGGGETRNKRSVWSISSLPTPEAHFATFPIDLPELCLKAGCPEGGTVLDPFSGAGTTGLACLKNGRNYIGIELNAAYIEIAHQRARKYYPLLIEATA